MSTPHVKRDFANVDHSGDPQHFVEYLDLTTSLGWMQLVKRLSFEKMHIEPGQWVLDVGCGTGEDACLLAGMVGPQGKVVGLDYSKAMIAEATNRAKNVDLPVEFRTGDVHGLDFPDSTFHSCRAERVFVHLEDPPRALTEIKRVTRPGGYVVATDADWGTLTIDGSDRALTQKVISAVVAHVRNGWIGRQYFGLLKRAGFDEIDVVTQAIPVTDYHVFERLVRLRHSLSEAVSQGVLSGAEAASFIAELEERDAQGLFFGSMTGFIVSGRKPSA